MIKEAILYFMVALHNSSCSILYSISANVCNYCVFYYLSDGDASISWTISKYTSYLCI